MSIAMANPLIVSFFTEDSYYSEAAGRLRSDCESVGLASDISMMTMPVGYKWIDVCRRKVRFCLEMHRKHDCPILWLDVDSRLARRPEMFDGATCDIAGFLRGFRYLRDFDPQSSPRFFAPFALYFNATPRATAFLELMAELESRHEGPATDDFFLQEAWKQHGKQLSVMVLPPYLVGREWPLRDDQIFYVGLSGNVSKYKDQAQQHTAEILAPSRRKAVLLHEAEEARRNGQLADAVVLYQRALDLEPDEALAGKIERLKQRESEMSERREAEQSDQTAEPARSKLSSLIKRLTPARRPR